MKKKIVALALVVVMLAVAITSATLAYLTDNDSAVNTFTVGNVKILLNEEQRNEDGTDLTTFKNDQKLLPIVGSAQGEKDKWGLPVASNYVDKIVTVTNTGSEDAWVRIYFAVPSALDDGYETFNASLNVVHWNFGNKLVDGAWTTTYQTDWNWSHETSAGKTAWNYYETEIDGVMYNVYFADYNYVLTANETTSRCIQGVYLDATANFTKDSDGKLVCTVVHGGQTVTVDGYDWESGVKFPVYAVACQAEGFADAASAITAAYGADFNPFGGVATNWQ
ncbi:MAG: SipW-dependent-type signal peptide-containing protein [Erysipelotrichaceae bacterium]